MDALLLIPLLAAAVSGVLACRSRAVYLLGRFGPQTAPAFLLSLWLLFGLLGQATGSVHGAAWAAALPLMGLFFWASRAARTRILSSPRLSRLDKAAMTLLGLYLLCLPTFDPIVHHAVVGMFRRGAVPPTAFNDPSRPLPYHALFTGAAALPARALGLSADAAMDLAAILLLPVLFKLLEALSRLFFESPSVRQGARLFFLFGFGPVYLRARTENPYWFLHGGANQSFLEAIARPPTLLGFTLFAWLVLAFLSRVRPASKGMRGAVPWPAALPALALLPHASEELAFFAAVSLALLALLRAWPPSALGASWAALGVSAAFSGAFRAFFSADSPMPVPGLACRWPPALPYWLGPAPLFSREGMKVLFLEWGPLFFAAWPLLRADPRRLAGPALFFLGFLPAVFLGTGERWGGNPDMDRFLFFPSALGFFLAAVFQERLESALGAGSRAYARARLTLAFLLCAGPLSCLAYRLGRTLPQVPERLRGVLWRPSGLERALAPVGPREKIFTDEVLAQELVLSGFLVAAPMSSNMVGEVDAAGLRSLAGSGRFSAEWLFLPETDARVSGKPAAGGWRGYRLVRARRAP